MTDEPQDPVQPDDEQPEAEGGGTGEPEPEEPGPRVVSLMLEVAIGDDELRQLGDELAGLLGEADAVEAEKADHARRTGEALKRLYGAASEKAALIRARSRTLPVDCEEVFDFAGGRVALVRTDNGTIARVRLLTDAERQQRIVEDEQQAAREASEEIRAAIDEFERQMREDSERAEGKAGDSDAPGEP